LKFKIENWISFSFKWLGNIDKRMASNEFQLKIVGTSLKSGSNVCELNFLVDK